MNPSQRRLFGQPNKSIGGIGKDPFALTPRSVVHAVVYDHNHKEQHARSWFLFRYSRAAIARRLETKKQNPSGEGGVAFRERVVLGSRTLL
jgi:hypothetical protein